MVRRPVAWIVALVLFAEALGVLAVNWFLGVVVDRQDMSLAGLDPDMMSVSSKAAGSSSGSTSPRAAWWPCWSPCATAPRPGSAGCC